MEDELLTLTEVADALKVSSRQVLYLIEDERLEAVRVSKRTIRVKKSVLEAYIDANTVNRSAT